MHTQSSPLDSNPDLPHNQTTPYNHNDDVAQHGAHSHQPAADTTPDGDVSASANTLAEGEPFILPPSVVADRKPRRRARTARQSAAASSRNDHDDDDSDEEDEPADTTCWVSLLPAEALQRVFQWLDPLSLARSALVSRNWSSVARDDATWRLAFTTIYGTSISLRRVAKSSWKQEYIRRTDLVRRWKKSRSPAITTDMRVGNITSIAYSATHNFMLSTSIAYGIASRSDPFKGKVARGFVDAAGVLNGAGIGNPNAEFSPDVTALDIAHEASRLAWGFRDGTVALTLLTRQGSNPRGMIRSVRFALRGAHAGPVNAIAFDLNKPGGERTQKARANLDEDVAETLVTGGEDGVVKLWTPLRALPLWVSGLPATPATPGTPAAAIVKIDYDADRGIIVAGTRSGSVAIWTGVNAHALLAISSHAWDDELSPELRSSSINDARASLVDQHRNVKRRDVVLPGDVAAPIDQVFLDAPGGSILVHREQDTCLFHIGLNVDDADEPFLTTLQPAGAEVAAGKITCLRADCSASSGTRAPSSAPSPSVSAVNILGPAPGSMRNLDAGAFAERRFVVAGTDDGKLLAWHLPSPSSSSPPSSISPSFALDVHHTPLTSIDFSPHLFAIGCSDGTIKAFDALSGVLIRTWNDRTATRHPARMLAAGQLTQDEAARFFVRQIVVGEESIVAAVGPHVLAWKAESALSGLRKRGHNGALSIPGFEGATSSSGSNASGSAPHSGRASRAANAGGLPPLSKYAQMREIKNELAESSTLLSAEREQRQASYERLRFARGPAEIGGLTEQEALEYAMMLSRDEEEARQASKAEQASGMTELARIRREEAELQQALEQIELAEGGGVGDESCFTVSSQASERGVDDDEDDDDGDEYGIRSYERSPSSSPSPALSASSPRAWNIVQNAGSHHLSTSSSSASRWGDASKVRTINVPRSARSPSSASQGQGPPPPSSLQSPEHWPAMGSSNVGSPLRLDDTAPSPWSSAPSPPAGSDRPAKGKGRANDGIGSNEGAVASSSFLAPSAGGDGSESQKGRSRVNHVGSERAPTAPSVSSPSSSPAPSSHPAWTGPGSAAGAWAKGTPPPWKQQRAVSIASSAAPTVPTMGSSGEDDEELRFAIELSLAEERSRRGQ